MLYTAPRLHHYFETACQTDENKVYVRTSISEYTYSQIYQTAKDFCSLLAQHGIKKNDRVVIYSSKNAESIAMMIACSTLAVVYVPISSLNPSFRAAHIIHETEARFVFCDEECSIGLLKEGIPLRLIYTNNGHSIYAISSPKNTVVNSTNLAFILFTSGSTGTPKGVMISHQAARIFIDWAASEFEIGRNEVLASIAPFNFDLSVFDIYVTAKVGATLQLYTETETKNALLMAQQISLHGVTTIYATPTFYSTLAYYGRLQKYDFEALKNVFFAGEVFHLENFNHLLQYWKEKCYVNLYGPTESNVCTYFKVDIEQMDYQSFPIGIACDYAHIILLNDENEVINAANIEAELLVSGISLFEGYWNDKEKSDASFYVHSNQIKYYRTGDIVYRNEEGEYVYVARKDRMIKKNGYRIEPSEIEKVMVAYPHVSNASVLYFKEKNQLICFIESQVIADKEMLELKIFCQNYLPLYMIPDKFVILNSMPKTSSGKIDLQALKERL